MPKTKMQGIVMPSQNDIISGRGKGVLNHAGNKNYRAIIAKWKLEYVKTTTHQEKNAVTSKVLKELRSLCPPANFLIRPDDSDLWYPMDEAAIIQKIKQALREKKVSPTTKPKDKNKTNPEPNKPTKPKPNPNPPEVTPEDWKKVSEVLGNKRDERNKSDESKKSEKEKLNKSTVDPKKKIKLSDWKKSCEQLSDEKKSGKSKDGKSSTIKNGKKKKKGINQGPPTKLDSNE